MLKMAISPHTYSVWSDCKYLVCNVRNYSSKRKLGFVNTRSVIYVLEWIRTGLLRKLLRKRENDSGFFSPSRSGPEFTVLIEGNIGVGKSTFLNLLKSEPGLRIYPEPVDKWKNINGSNALELMYKDPKRWSLTFQSYVQKTMLENHTARQSEPIKLMERSIFSGHHCFTQNLYNSGLMSDMEHSVLNSWYNWIIEHELIDVDLIVYLRSSPETCLQRIKQRKRKEEMSISLEYLTKIHKLHEEWLMNSTSLAGFTGAKLLVLDADVDLERFKIEMDKHRSTIIPPRSPCQSDISM